MSEIKEIKKNKEKKVNSEEEDEEIFSIYNLKGVGPITYEKLVNFGYDSLITLSNSNPKILSEKCDISLKLSKQITSEARKISLLDKFKTGLDYYKEKELEERVNFGLKKIDDIFRGGIDPQTITEIYGESGSGKTQICFYLAIRSVLSKNLGGLEGEVIYMDTESNFRPERIKEICDNLNYDYKIILKKIKYVHVKNTSHQIFMIDKLRRYKNLSKVKLLILDSVTSNFRSEYIGRGYLSERQQVLNSHLKSLKEISGIGNFPIILTNQVFSKPDSLYGDPIRPIGGNIMAHSSTYRIYLRKAKDKNRLMRIVGSPTHPESSVLFKITKKGLEEVLEK